MNAHILPVFVSSTWLDLEPERIAVRDAVMRMRETQFVGMEYFGSRDETTRRASLDEVDRSELYVGLFAARYGSGITEDEYRRARVRGLPCLIYFKSDATIPDDLREADPAQTAKLDALKQELRANHIIGPDFLNPHDLAAKVTADLHRWLFDNYLTPKLRGALRGEVPRADAQALLDAVKDLSGLNRDLLTQLQSKGFSVSIEGDYVGRDKVTNIYTAPGVPAPVIPTLHQLRAPVGDFVGREKEIADLLATLRGGGSAAITGISGMGGIGKTELALYVAERLRDAYTDAQLVLDMRGTDDAPRDPADALASCIRGFVGLEQRLPDDLGELKRLYTSALEGKRALILLDNARDNAQVRPLLPPKGSALLVTSRETIPIPGMKRVMLEELQPVEARELLTGIAPRVAPDIADRICYLCGYLPLAVRAAASLLDVTVDLDPEEYAAQLANERTRLERIGAEGVDVSVEASFNLSYARLSPDAARVFRQLAVFPATFDAVAEEMVCEDEGHKHLSELVRRNLVLYNSDTHRYRLHDLARIFANSYLSEEERTATRIRYLEFYEQQLITARNIGDRIGVGSALSNLSAIYISWGNIRRAIECSEQHLTVTRELGYLPLEGNTLFIISLLLRSLGERAKAIAPAEAALEIFEQIESPNAAKARAALAQWRGEA
jgi:tetratricopeptide (TPR) repeat protein